MAATSIKLDGSKPLWPHLKLYIHWLMTHEDEIHDHYMAGDENADLIVHIIAEKDVARDHLAAATLMVVVERYIATYHPEIATIEAAS